MIALLPVRTQSSLATSCVIRSLGRRPMRRRVSPILRSERMLRKGDCPSCTARACFSAPVKDCISGRVVEVGQYNRVFFCQRRCRTQAKVESTANQGGHNQHGGENKNFRASALLLLRFYSRHGSRSRILFTARRWTSRGGTFNCFRLF